MGLFDDQVRQVLAFREARAGSARELDIASLLPWPSESSLVLEEDAAIDLGHPLAGSVAFLVWTGDDGLFESGAELIGPDLPDIAPGRAPFGQAVILGGSFAEEYDCYRDLKDIVYGVKLRGLMSRAMPSRQTFWFRVSKEARDRDLSLAHLGKALVDGLTAVDYVSKARVVFVTSGKGDIGALRETADQTGRVAGALIKMYEEMNYDCESCEYSDVCDEVAELKTIRARAEKDKAR